MIIKTIPEADAGADLRRIYDGDREALGFVRDHAKAFSLRPEVAFGDRLADLLPAQVAS